ISSRMTAKSNDVAEGMGYEKKRKPLSRKRTGKQEYCITGRILSSLWTTTGSKERPLLIGLQHENKFVAIF
ncbi:hypothetical protein, partial [Priestia megaterium]|uniref:hypothetical protein n=2 Tax=Priestia megaterium TaxID=1404 RepID=UPI001CDC4842